MFTVAYQIWPPRRKGIDKSYFRIFRQVAALPAWTSINVPCYFPNCHVRSSNCLCVVRHKLSPYGQQMVGTLYVAVWSTSCRQMVAYNFQAVMCGPQIVSVWSGTSCLRMASKWSAHFMSQYGRRLVDKWSPKISKLSCAVLKQSLYGEAKILGGELWSLFCR